LLLHLLRLKDLELKLLNLIGRVLVQINLLLLLLTLQLQLLLLVGYFFLILSDLILLF